MNGAMAHVGAASVKLAIEAENGAIDAGGWLGKPLSKGGIAVSNVAGDR